MQAPDRDACVERDGIGQPAAWIRQPHRRPFRDTPITHVRAVRCGVPGEVPVNQGQAVMGADCPAVQMLWRQDGNQQHRDQRGESGRVPAHIAH